MGMVAHSNDPVRGLMQWGAITAAAAAAMGAYSTSVARVSRRVIKV